VTARTAVVTGGSGIGLAIAQRSRPTAAPSPWSTSTGRPPTSRGQDRRGRRHCGRPGGRRHRPRPHRGGGSRGRQALTPPTILVNNAGLQGFDRFLSISIEKWQQVLEVNLTGTFHCCQVVAPT
jgi:NAD(P)-dependent dehydrogenase (short-subunit alcohol dehydrogenase family)